MKSIPLTCAILAIAAAMPAAYAQGSDPPAGPAEPNDDPANREPVEEGVPDEGDDEDDPDADDQDGASPSEDPLGEPVTGIGGLPDDSDTDSAIDAAIDGLPPARLKSWELAGRLIDPEPVVRGFLAPVMHERESWTAEDQAFVVEFLKQLGYHMIIRTEPDPTGGVKATLVLEPITRVRYVEIDLDITILDRATQPIFADEIRRRMTLRPGAPLALDRAARAEQLQGEAERIASYLQDDGFYDAYVSVVEEPLGSFEARIKVDVSPGPPYFVGDLKVTGNTALPADEIVKLFHHDRTCLPFKICFGKRRFSRQQLNRDIERLIEKYQKRGYPGVRVRTTYDPRYSFNRATQRVEFTIEIRERRKIDVVFEGNDLGDFSEDKLYPVLTLAEEGSYDDVEVEASAAALRRYYQSKGYFEANIAWERVRFGDFERSAFKLDRIIFNIDRGPKLQVKAVRFHGNEAISDEELRNEVKTRVFRRIILGKQGGYATSLQLEQDIERILRLYRLAGFRDARVTLRATRDRDIQSAAVLSAAIAADKPADGLYVDFDIEEGPRVMVQDVVFEFVGDQTLPEEEIRRVIKMRADRPFLEGVAVRDTERLQRHYFSRGFPRAGVAADVRPVSEDTVVVAYRVTEGIPKRIGKIALRGNFKTQDWVIFDELGLREGQPLTVGAAENAQSNLDQSGLFSAVQIDYVGLESDRQEVVNVLVQVEERHDNLLEGDVGGGYSTDSLWFVEGTTHFHNILGTGLRFDNRITYGQQEKVVDGKLAAPHWIMRRYTGLSFLAEIAAAYKLEDTERFGPLSTASGSIAATKEGRRGFFQGWLVSLRYDFRLRQRDIDFVRTAGNSGDIEQTKVSTRSSAIGPLLVIDKRRDAQGRRNPLLPARGFRLQARTAYAEDWLLGTARFIKIGTSGQHYLSFGDRIVISNGVRYDHGIPLGGAVLLPEVERYFAGGDTTVRGYEEDRLATELVTDPLAPLEGVDRFQLRPAGGNIRFIHNLDLQLRVWDDPVFDFPIASAIFFDSGIVTNSLVGFQVRDLRHSLGVALGRWVLPFGSLSVEYAIPLDVERGDNPRGRFHVNLGVLF